MKTSDTPRTDAAYSASTSVGIYELFSSAQQMEREINAANARIAELEAHVARLEEARMKSAAINLSNMLSYERAINKIERLVNEGDKLAGIVERDYKGAFTQLWKQAKEAKP